MRKEEKSFAADYADWEEIDREGRDGKRKD